MPTLASPRFSVPFLETGQAQKELTHNEAIFAVDSLLHPVVEGSLATPPATLNEADAGKSWIIGANASGGWSGKVGQIACWTGASWRYHLPVECMTIFDKLLGIKCIFRNGLWVQPTSIAAPNGGTTIDAEARATIAQIREFLFNTAQIPA